MSQVPLLQFALDYISLPQALEMLEKVAEAWSLSPAISPA
jgi:3-keto-L-gulonate-6-phosphate decarboxylase